jgi:hypothetical protein
MRVPVSSQVVVKPEHVPHAPYVVVPQVVPSVMRVQLPLSEDIGVVHTPPPHTGVVTLRVRVPVSSQTLLKLPHGPHAP